ncbi:hypothetical protein B0H14DRAFT_3490085 [Mycena olivaceomarginata]|nr:hypothetical protein B0H14DRAFT_3490085 [Mycena olivaceomarginata]
MSWCVVCANAFSSLAKWSRASRSSELRDYIRWVMYYREDVVARSVTLPLLFLSLLLHFWPVLLDAASQSEMTLRLPPRVSRFIHSPRDPICTVERIPTFDGPIPNSRGSVT